ncbi:MAG: Na+/H+ antiporter NhaA [Gemmataceae bacterium]
MGIHQTNTALDQRRADDDLLLLGLEIKREFAFGELRDPRKAVLPVAAALGGMLAPAGVYCLVLAETPRHRGLGRLHGHRHRIRGRFSGLTGPSRHLLAQDLPADAGHRRRCRSRISDCPGLYGERFAVGTGRGRHFHCLGEDCSATRCSQRASLLVAGRTGLARIPEVRHPPDRGFHHHAPVRAGQCGRDSRRRGADEPRCRKR